MTLTPDATNDKVTFTHGNSGVTAASRGDTSNQTPGFGGTFKVPSGTVNARGHLTAFADHTVKIPNTAASTSAAGLMSAADKTKLNGIASGANAYTHPGYTQRNTGLYKVHVDSQGHVDAVTSVAKGDITGLGIPAQDTTYSTATTGANGLMSATDKTELNAFANNGIRSRARGSETSLDQFTTPGVYYVSTNVITDTNSWPYSGNVGASLLEVLKAQGSSSSVVVYVQRLVVNANSDTPELWFRTKYGTGTGNWRMWQPISSGYTPL